jgi:hypothetical protein
MVHTPPSILRIQTFVLIYDNILSFRNFCWYRGNMSQKFIYLNKNVASNSKNEFTISLNVHRSQK